MAWYEIIRHNISAVMFMIGFLKTVLKFWVVTKLAIHAIAKMLSAVKNELIQLEEYYVSISKQYSTPHNPFTLKIQILVRLTLL